MVQQLLQYKNYPLVIQIALWISLVVIIGFILLHLILFYRRLRGALLSSKQRNMISRFESLSIPHIVLNPQLGKLPVGNIQLPLEEYAALGLYKNKTTRLFFTEYLMQLSDNFSGNVHLLIRKLYKELGLGRYASRLLHSGKRNIVLGLHELTFFNEAIEEPLVYKLINHPDKLVRQEAVCYALKLFPDPLRVLSSIEVPFSAWAQVEYFEIIKGRNDVEMPDFRNWIVAGGNRSVVRLCVDLAVYFQQVDAADALLALLNTEDAGFKRKLINALGKLFDPSPAPVLEALYEKETDLPVKVEMLKALGRMGNEESVPFLQRVFKTETHVLLKKHAAYSLYGMNVSRAALAPLYATASPAENEILGYIQHPLIKYI